MNTKTQLYFIYISEYPDDKAIAYMEGDFWGFYPG